MSKIITPEGIFTTIKSVPATVESIHASVESSLVTVESGSITSAVSSILDREIFEGVPLWVIISIVLTIIFIFLIIMLISWIFHAEKEAKRKVHHKPSSHDVMVELQKELLKSMEATSRQNRLMIWLTILFITVSILGGAVVINFFQNIKDFSATWFSQFVEFVNSIMSQ